MIDETGGRGKNILLDIIFRNFREVIDILILSVLPPREEGKVSATSHQPTFCVSDKANP